MKKVSSKLTGPFLLMIAQYTTQIVWPLVNLLVVRYLGSEQFGLYASAIAIITILSLLPDFGLQQAALNLNARRRFSIGNILGKSLRMGAIYALVATLIVLVWVNVLPYKMEVRWLSLLLALTFFRISIVTVITSGLQVLGQYSRIAFWNLLVSSSQWIATLVLMLAGAALYPLVFVPVVISFGVAVLMLLVQGKSLLRIRSADVQSSARAEDVPVKELLGGSWRFGLAASLHQLYYKSDAAILTLYRSPEMVGLYTVSFKIIELFFMFPGVVFNQVLYPKYVLWCREDVPKLRSYYNIMNKVMLLTGILVTFFLLFFGSELLLLLFGENHPEAVVFLNILAIAVPLRFWVSSVGAVLTNEKLISIKLKVQAGIALLNVSLNFILIPFYGGVGAAASMFITHVVLLIAYSYYAHKEIFGFSTIKAKDWLYPLLVIVVGGALFLPVAEQNEWLKAIAFLIVVAASVPSAVGWLQKSERAQLLSLAKGRKEAKPQTSAV